MFKALVDNEIIAAAIVVFFGKKATYLHACSDYDKRDYFAPNLLNFEAIKMAKEKGCSIYDFWGADMKKMPGVTMFKEGFSKDYIIYPKSKDIIFNFFMYFIIKFAYILKRFLRKIK
jgi:lipid II:glycine glycyltransferase (peptidoglycan interpeptide bridge formation enzyme)